MANEKTKNLGLELTIDNNTLFRDWWKIMAGKGPVKDADDNILVNKSNMELIDSAFSDLYNDIYNKSETEDVIDDAITEALKGFTKFDIQVVESIADVVEAGHLYLVLKDSTDPNGGYYEYIYVEKDNKAELVGSVDITFDDKLDSTSINGVQNKVVADAINNINNTVDNLADVALSGEYTDIINIPTFKTINDEEVTGEGNIEIKAGVITVDKLPEEPEFDRIYKLNSDSSLWTLVDGELVKLDNSKRVDHLEEQFNYLKLILNSVMAEHNMAIPESEIDEELNKDIIIGELPDGSTIPLEYKES